MNDCPVNESPKDVPDTEFPMAKVVDATPGLLSASKMWWVTLACAALAVVLAIRSMPAGGREIKIHFPEGHGLKAGDAVRYRGIEVGSVTEVSLNQDVSGIDVNVTLKPGGGALDRKGTRFWIVRPRLSLTEVSGLDTAVGAKYIGVSPGEPTDEHWDDFEGLAAVPPDELDHGGLQVILRSDDKHGISPGAPVTWRGVKTGKVLSVNLSPDARHVHITIRIDRAYRRLVRPSSKFWVTSGFGVDIGLTGVKLNAESLSTIIEGGVSFVTLAEGAGDSSVRDGHVFTLAKEIDKDWVDGETNIPLIDFQLPETVLIRGEKQTTMLGFSRSKEFTQTGLLVQESSKTFVLTGNLPLVEEMTMFNAFEFSSARETAVNVLATAVDSCQQIGTGVVLVPVNSSSAVVDTGKFRTPTQPEDCLVVRSAVVDNKSTPIIQTIDLEQIAPQEATWVVQNADVDFSEWHGSPVVAMEDGKIIGVLLTDSGSPLVALFSQSGN